MKRFLHSPRVQENLIYYSVWFIFFLSPVVFFHLRQVDGNTLYDWDQVLKIWTQVLLPFFLLFVVHNHVVAPLWLDKGKFWLYLSLMLALVGLFTVAQCTFSAPQKELPAIHAIPPSDDGRRGEPRGDRHRETDAAFRPDSPVPREGFRSVGQDPGHRPDVPDRLPDHEPPHDEHLGTDLFFNQDFRLFLAVSIAVLMLGMNLFVKQLFRNARREREAMQAQQEHLRQQLAYLKYQISPHFFMNTLNNIHALVDIDTAEAKTTIIQLSRLMRYVLYESDNERVPLSHDIEFIRSYIALMKIRYTSNVRITVSVPEDLPDVSIPPMLFINFVENAFKHGVSYSRPSYVEVSLRLYDEELHFSCVNSRHPATSESSARQSHGGLGIANARQRLDLIFGEAYTLDIRETPERYEVNLLFKV